MKYCIHCGYELQADFKYCTHCQGEQPAQSEQPIQPESIHTEKETEEKQITRGTAEQQPSQRRPNHTPQMRPGLKKRTKIFMASAAGLLLVLFATHFALKSYLNPERDVQAMDQAIVNNDAEAFLSYVDFQDHTLLDKEHYFQYIKEYEWDAVKSQMTAHMEEPAGLSQKIFGRGEVPIFSLNPQKLFFGLYRTYDIAAIPVKAVISTPYDETHIKVGVVNEQLNLDEQIELFAYPGVFDLEARTETTYGEFQHTQTIEIMPQTENLIEIAFEGREYSFQTDQPDAFLYVNGKNTEQRLKDLHAIGPFPEENKAAVSAFIQNEDGESFNTEEIQVNEVDHNHLDFTFGDISPAEDMPDDQMNDEDAGELVLDFRDAYEKALNNKDYNRIESYLLKGTIAEEELKEYVGDLKDTDYDYHFISNEVTNVDMTDNDTAIVETRETFIFTNHLGKETDYDRKKRYTVVLTDDGNRISKIEYVDTKRD